MASWFISSTCNLDSLFWLAIYFTTDSVFLFIGLFEYIEELFKHSRAETVIWCFNFWRWAMIQSWTSKGLKRRSYLNEERVMGNGLEDGKIKNIGVQSLSSYTFSVLFNYFTLPLPLIVFRFAFLLPRFPFLLGASLITAVNWHSTKLCCQEKRQYAKYYDNQLKKAKLHSIWAFIEWLIHLSICFCTLNIIHSFNCNNPSRFSFSHPICRKNNSSSWRW